MTSALTGSALDVSTLRSIVESAAADTAAWQSKLRFEPAGRWWTQLSADPAVDIWLLSWLNSQETDLHDHGLSSAAFTVVSGALRELRPQGPKMMTYNREPGETSQVAPGVVHDVSNPWPEPAVSIHAYSPPLSTMTYYRRTSTGVIALETQPTREPV